MFFLSCTFHKTTYDHSFVIIHYLITLSLAEGSVVLLRDDVSGELLKVTDLFAVDFTLTVFAAEQESSLSGVSFNPLLHVVTVVCSVFL